ncbi:unnamed protein product [marine sediment metagenome]|uniref:Uncharacterized protein n=1 Tax=marine sediment metagenome TaxID=412755 RepID=X1E5Z9_9ZZZZ
MKKNILILTLSLVLIIGMSFSALGAQKEVSWLIGSEPPSLDPCLAILPSFSSLFHVYFLFLCLCQYLSLSFQSTSQFSR